jgi:hypothetical protein
MSLTITSKKAKTFWLAAAAIIVSSTPSFPQQTPDQIQSLAAQLKQAIQGGNFTGAALLDSQLITAAFEGIVQNPPASFEPSQTPALNSGDAAAVLARIDAIVQAHEQNDSIAVRDLSTSLSPAIVALMRGGHPSPATVLSGLELAASTASGRQRFDLLPKLAKAAYDAGNLPMAENTSAELLGLAVSNPGWPQGEAVFSGNMTLGLVAFTRGDVSGADSYLLAAGTTVGTSALRTFGPSMDLANRLLQQGQRATVLQYLTLCKAFWKQDHGAIAQWSTDITAGKSPQFGANLAF